MGIVSPCVFAVAALRFCPENTVLAAGVTRPPVIALAPWPLGINVTVTGAFAVQRAYTCIFALITVVEVNCVPPVAAGTVHQFANV